MQWLWLEDQEGTITGLRANLEKLIDVKVFDRIPKLTRYLLQEQEAISTGKTQIGFILDVMIANAYRIVRPVGWFGCEDERHFDTENGYWAGLVYYKDMILGTVDEGKAIVHPPPPVLFLTVMTADAGEVQRRLAEVKTCVRKVSGSSEARVEWIRKRDTSSPDLADVLRKLKG